MMISWSPGTTLDEIEKQVILAALGHFRNNKTATANALGITARTIDNKIALYAKEKAKQEEANAEARRRAEEHLARARGLPVTAEQCASPSAQAWVGDGPQSPKDFGAQHPMSMPKREEVQDMLPQQAAVGGSGKSR